MKIGSLEIGRPLFLAPMAGITDISFRTLMRQMGCSVVFSELISSEAMIRYNRRTARMIRISDEERPVGIQIFGSKPKAMADTARMVQDAGADFVDINLGCPVRKVVKQGAGAALLENPEILAAVLKEVRAALEIPMTIKTRTGWNHDRSAIPHVLRIAEESGVDAVTIHGRSREQAYTGEADWGVIAEAKAATKIPVIGNGDLTSWPKAVKRWEETGCDGIMIGRGALRNPWIFEEVAAHLEGRDPDSLERNAKKLLTQHVDLLCHYEESAKVLLQLKKFVAWYSTGRHGSSQFRARLFKMTSIDDVLNEALSFFRDVVDEDHVGAISG